LLFNANAGKSRVLTHFAAAESPTVSYSLKP